MIEVNLMKSAAVTPSQFFNRHRTAICVALFACAMVTLAMGHRLSVAHTAPAAAPEVPAVQTAQSASSPSQG